MTKHVICSIFAGTYMYKYNVKMYCWASNHMGFNISAFKILNIKSLISAKNFL